MLAMMRRRPAHAESGALPPLLRIVEPQPEERYVTCVPLVPLKTATGAFNDPQHIDDDDFAWAAVETERRLRRSMFVAQVVGKSMESTTPRRRVLPLRSARRGYTSGRDGARANA